MNFAATLNHWFHLASAIFWIGGAAFQLIVIVPFLKSDRPPPDYILALANRFHKCVGPIILILIVTGGLNIGFRRGGHALPPGYISALGLKVLLVAAAASLHLFGMVRPQPGENGLQEYAALPRRTSVQWTVLIGLFIIFIASMLRHWSS